MARERIAELLSERVQRTAGHYARVTGMDREDLQQEMWLGMLLGLEQVDVRVGDPLCYLYLRGKWRLLEAIRSSERKSRDTTFGDTPPAICAGPDEEVLTRWMVGELSHTLSVPQRRILAGLLHGLRQEELARQLNCTAANISYHVKQIRQRYHSLSAEG